MGILDFVYEFQENLGQAAALNRGLKFIKGEYLVWPDSDDELMPEFIEKKVELCYFKQWKVFREVKERKLWTNILVIN